MTKNGASAILRETTQSDSSKQVVEDTINLALSVMTMLKFGPVPGERSPCRHLHWREGSLNNSVEGHFVEKPVLTTDGIKLPRSFNAWSLETISGIGISFTDNLADHLLLVEDEKGMKVLIFHHISFLKFYKNAVFPEGLLQETVDTLALIFPNSEFGTVGGFVCRRRKWLEELWSRHRDQCIDTGTGTGERLQAEARRIEKSRFWRDRLVVLEQAYDDATPSSMSQWWHDRRNRVVWCTFWIAIFVLILGVIVGVVQSVLGGIQVGES
ncbi:hypothetical protein C8035_v002309 [Colletotrichum spinosum]|uniref:Uncharacterized protein n=1 Tax=Colletotrichum spinosum TaxID=1347390 RepID=A0A4R8PYI0_9PEZI|nr:hypothetical protein C8035_v002309 [Colletotrichum spinosum]